MFEGDSPIDLHITFMLEVVHSLHSCSNIHLVLNTTGRKPSSGPTVVHVVLDMLRG